MKILLVTFLLFFISCNDFIPDQDAVITVIADKDSTHQYINLDCTKVYDTTLSTLTCQLVIKDGSKPDDKDLKLFFNKKLIKQSKTTNGTFDFGWLQPGTYSLQVGSPNKYPCFDIYALQVPGGKGYQLSVHLPRNH